MVSERARPSARTGIRSGADDPDGPFARTASAEDFDRPSSARVYDFLLGGSVNGAVDRELGRALTLAEPVVVGIVRENRAFLRRAVTHLARAGLDQFLDLGSAIPSMGNVHEVARRVDPAARVAYVDVDPVAVEHARALLAGTTDVTITHADLRDPDAVLDAPAVAATLDLSRPVALCLFSVLQHVPDADRPGDVVRRYLDRLAPGSAVAVSHLTSDDVRLDMPAVTELTGAYSRGPVTPRSAAEITAMLEGLELVDPGVVWAARWHPDGEPATGVASGHRVGVGFRR